MKYVDLGWIDSKKPTIKRHCGSVGNLYADWLLSDHKKLLLMFMAG